MKNKVASGLLIALTTLATSACSLIPSGGSNGIYVPDIDNSEDLSEYSEGDYVTGDETYYVSEYISFIMEVRGYYQINVPFTIDKNDENLRIYDNMYFYEGDFFQLMSSDYRHIWATLKNENNDYLIPLREQGEDVQVDVKKSGVYKITLDIKTMMMDFEYKNAIETPYYYPFKSCDIGTLVDDRVVYNTMSVNPNNSDEFMISDYQVETGKLYSFYSGEPHTSNYKLTVAEDAKKYISPTMFETSVVFNFSGKFNIYVNNKTYQVRAEADPLSLVYDCVVYENGEFVALTPKDPTVPYVFEYQYEATSDVGGYGLVSDDVPSFYNKSYNKYELTIEESSLLGKDDSKGEYYFKKPGQYLLIIDLFNLTLKVEQAQ